jgi:pimeloyl-ACP methyl ester carboxylesterase
VLFIHGYPFDRSIWTHQVAALEGWSRIAPDLRGMGQSDAPDLGYNMETYAADLAALLDLLGVDEVVLVGLSMGGYVAFELWRAARPRVAALVLANTRAEPDAPEGAAARRALAERLKVEGHDFLVAEPPPLLSADAPDDLWQRVKRIIADQTPGAIAAASLGMAERPDSVPDLPGIDVPTLVITGTGDRLIPPDVTAGIAQGVPGAQLLRIEGAGHLSNLEAPGEFNTALEGVLTRVEP